MPVHVRSGLRSVFVEDQAVPAARDPDQGDQKIDQALRVERLIDDHPTGLVRVADRRDR
jgi:hypothetical protein